MTDASVKRLALVLSIQAEVEAMKVQNLISMLNNEAPAHPSESFQHVAHKLEELAYRHEDTF